MRFELYRTRRERRSDDAPAGGDAYREVALGAPLRGSLASTSVELADGGCLRDFRLVFRDGRTLIYPPSTSAATAACV
ncbi:hypothetical protein [Luteimonas salinilitoris]|uniref:Uncharacterized protein n=1 Tax=Luteimonas salinilitoris TaxID=3237697 RepID=A0ABV4HQ09_9GAMM